MRLIDADALYERAYKLNLDYIVSDVELRTLKRLLLEEPTVETANVTEVIRCKDCRFYLQSNEKCELVDTRLRFYETNKKWTEDCFCSWGERREDNAEIH